MFFIKQNFFFFGILFIGLCSLLSFPNHYIRDSGLYSFWENLTSCVTTEWNKNFSPCQYFIEKFRMAFSKDKCLSPFKGNFIPRECICWYQYSRKQEKGFSILCNHSIVWRILSFLDNLFDFCWFFYRTAEPVLTQ